MFQFSKKVYKSFLTQGLSIPKNLFQEVYNLLGYIPQGASIEVEMMLDRVRYGATITHILHNDEYTDQDHLHFYWTDPRLKERYCSLFSTSHQYFKTHSDKKLAPENYYTITYDESEKAFVVTYLLDSSTPNEESTDSVAEQNAAPYGFETSHDKPYYLDRFANLRRTVKDGVKAPHKLVMLLTVIEQMQEEQFEKYPTFWLSASTIKRFNDIWKRFRCDRTPFNANPHIPFEHLASEGFWHYDKVTRIATLDEELFACIKADTGAFVHVLVDQLGGMDQYPASHWYALSRNISALSSTQTKMARNFGKLRENNRPFSTQQTLQALDILRTIDNNQ